MEDKITDFLFEILELNPDEVDLERDTNLIELGLDSLKAIELVVLIEDGFDISISDDDLLVDNLATLERIEELVSSYVDMNARLTYGR